MARTDFLPWEHYVSKVEQLFKYDAEVQVVYSERDNILTLFVSDETKAVAIDELMPQSVSFNNTTIDINVQIPKKDKVKSPRSIALLYEMAFYNNPIFSYVKTVSTVDLTYVVFAPIIAQYYNGDLNDINGQCTTLYQEIAKDVFKPQEKVRYCTDFSTNNLLKE